MKKNPFVYYGKKALVFLLSVFILIPFCLVWTSLYSTSSEFTESLILIFLKPFVFV